MGLELFPKACPCNEHKGEQDCPVGMTHSFGGPCPVLVEGDRCYWVTRGGHPITCCWFPGDAAVLNLDAIGRHDLAQRVAHDMTCAEARRFSEALEVAANDLGRHAAGRGAPRGGPGWAVSYEDDGRWVSAIPSDGWSPEEAGDFVCELARWYREVALAGCGVAVLT